MRRHCQRWGAGCKPMRFAITFGNSRFQRTEIFAAWRLQSLRRADESRMTLLVRIRWHGALLRPLPGGLELRRNDDRSHPGPEGRLAIKPCQSGGKVTCFLTIA